MSRKLPPSAQSPDVAGLPTFLEPLARRAGPGTEVLGTPLRPVPDDWRPRHSAVLILIAGSTLPTARLIVEERGHRMRSQPGQFALPGGAAEPADADRVATALREAHEEVGLDPATVRVLGSFAPIPMPWRDNAVHPVAGWTPTMPDVRAADPHEVERVEAVPLVGDDSLVDTRCRFQGRYEGRAVGPVFSLSGERFIWGFTAVLIEQVLHVLGIAPTPPADGGRLPPTIEIPAARRREGGTPARRERTDRQRDDANN